MAGILNRMRSKGHGSLASPHMARSEIPPESARHRDTHKRPSFSRWGSKMRSSQEKDIPSSNSFDVELRKTMTSSRTKSANFSFARKQRSGSRKSRRNSLGTSSRRSGLEGISTRQSMRYNDIDNSGRKNGQTFKEEEEKKETGFNEGDEYYESPEFRGKVAQQAAELDKEGNAFFENGDFDKAFLSYERALKLKRATLQVNQQEEGGQDMLTETESQKASILASVATSINNMTYLRQRAGQATADETMAAYLKSLQIKREILGPNHLSVGKTLNNIGSVFYLKREFVAALKAYENAHEIMGAQLGKEHLDVGTVLSNIGDVHSAMRHRKEALEYYRRALDIRWTKLGRADPKVIRLMEQTAALMTGRQPQKDDEQSDSEDEEFVREDERRRQEFQAECQSLAKELVEDVKFFDLVERNMAIEMVKQKTIFRRAMRQLSSGMQNRPRALSDSLETSFSENLGDSEANDDSDDELSVRSAPADVALDFSDLEYEEAPEVVAFLEEIGAAKRFSGSVSRSSVVTPPRKLGGRRGQKTPPTSRTTPPSEPRKDRGDAIETLLPRTPGGETPMRNVKQNTNGLRLSRDNPSKNPLLHSSQSTVAFTSDERRLALMAVKERVNALKSKRESSTLELDSQQAAEARHNDSIEPKRKIYIKAAQSPF